jgi:hypothetical protein
MIFSSLLVCLVRDPGNPNAAPTIDGAKADEDELGLREALIADDDISSPNRWCRKCWVSVFARHLIHTSFFISWTGAQTWKGTSLLDLWKMRPENGYACLPIVWFSLLTRFSRPSLSLDRCKMHRKSIAFPKGAQADCAFVTRATAHTLLLSISCAASPCSQLILPLLRVPLFGTPLTILSSL